MKHLFVAGLALLAAACSGEPRDLPVAELDCRSGLYLAADGEAIAISPTSGDGYRWRTLDGQTGALDHEGALWRSTLGWTGDPDGMTADLEACGATEISFGKAGAMRNYARTPLDRRCCV